MQLQDVGLIPPFALLQSLCWGPELATKREVGPRLQLPDIQN